MKPLMITVRNVSNESIILDEIAVAPHIFGIANGDSTHAMAEAVMGRGKGLSGVNALVRDLKDKRAPLLRSPQAAA
jgi:hypothetical protein